MQQLRPLLALTAALTLTASTQALARANGIAADACTGCHSGGQTPTVQLTSSDTTPMPGDTVTLTVRISAVNGSTGGLFLTANNTGTFSLISGEGTQLLNGEVVHSSPKSASMGQVQFRVRWTAPSTPSGAHFEVWGLSANGSNTASGDKEGYARLDLLSGCSGTTFFADLDRDGVGSAQSGTIVDCTAPVGYSAKDGDCNDYDPGAYPGAAETCNMKDDDCDSRVDEFAKPVCGVGMCARRADTCDPNTCTPGHPIPEACNGLDDDCDGTADEEAPCPSGQLCHHGNCVMGEAVADAGTSSSGTDPDGGSNPVTDDAPDAGTTVAQAPSPPADGPPDVGCSAAPGALSLGFASLLLYAAWMRRARRHTARAPRH